MPPSPSRRTKRYRPRTAPMSGSELVGGPPIGRGTLRRNPLIFNLNRGISYLRQRDPAGDGPRPAKQAAADEGVAGRWPAVGRQEERRPIEVPAVAQQAC